ncbi:MAG: phage tail protein [Alphaproteobacteria bacterium]|nr:phage tail protein [Alphaproteobacteria bacterium]
MSLTTLMTLAAQAGAKEGLAELGVGIPSPLAAFNFLVEIEGIIMGGFNSVSGLGGSVETHQIREGGWVQTPRTFVTGTRWGNLTLKHGLVENDTLWNWYAATTRGVIRRRSGAIILLDHDRAPSTLWMFKDAIPVRWEGPGLDAQGSGMLATETIELQHCGLDKPLWAQAGTAALGITRLSGARE